MNIALKTFFEKMNFFYQFGNKYFMFASRKIKIFLSEKIEKDVKIEQRGIDKNVI